MNLVKKWGLMLILFLFFISAVTGAQASEEKLGFFQYKTDDGETVNLFVGEENLKFEIGTGPDKILFLYHADTSPSTLYMVQPAVNMAFKLTHQELRRVAAQLNSRYKNMEENMKRMMRDIPPGEREGFRRTMPDFSRITIDTPPQVNFIKKEKIKWKQLPAQRGYFEVNNEKRGTAILLDSPPLEVSNRQKETVSGFQKILNGWVQILRRQAAAGNNPYNETRNLLGGYHLRLAELEEDGNKIELTGWQLKEKKTGIFKLPTDINVQAVETALLGPGLDY
jgi:hypothetical protein